MLVWMALWLVGLMVTIVDLTARSFSLLANTVVVFLIQGFKAIVFIYIMVA